MRDTDKQFPSRDTDIEELIRRINESPHDGSKVEKIDLSGVINPVDLDEDFEEGIKDLMKEYDGVLRALGEE